MDLRFHVRTSKGTRYVKFVGSEFYVILSTSPALIALHTHTHTHWRCLLQDILGETRPKICLFCFISYSNGEYNTMRC